MAGLAIVCGPIITVVGLFEPQVYSSVWGQPFPLGSVGNAAVAAELARLTRARFLRGSPAARKSLGGWLDFVG